MASPAHEAPSIPKPVLVAAGCLMVLSIVFAGIARQTDVGATRLTLAPAVESLDLTFHDLPGGAVGITDVRRGRPIAAFEPGTNGFVRVVMRSLAHDRGRMGVGADVPFRLNRHADGLATLEDPATGSVVTLKAFGHDNAKAFLQLFELGRKS